ncbi:hypothetical protein DEO72_LG3g2451 [Vigna unguiculata]|uniref:Uncharacterized protein n=1 Tax=Vigna unguiculata TaxID=3917 RepID=A0A4D6LH40_VIGUN|nr:hypothetical protein DEO72_LG3g2451 [Vigna unguiculata]
MYCGILSLVARSDSSLALNVLRYSLACSEVGSEFSPQRTERGRIRVYSLAYRGIFSHVARSDSSLVLNVLRYSLACSEVGPSLVLIVLRYSLTRSEVGFEFSPQHTERGRIRV